MFRSSIISLFFILSAIWTIPLKAQTNGSGSGTINDPYIVNSFPYTFNTVNSSSGQSAIGMQGICSAIPCCSVLVFKVTLPANGVLRGEMTNYTPLASGLMAYIDTTSAGVTSYSDLTFVASPGNFCGFRDTVLLGRYYRGWDYTPYGQTPTQTDDTRTNVYDPKNPIGVYGFMPAGDYYILYWNGNQQTNQGIGQTSDVSFEFVEACAPLSVPTVLNFDTSIVNSEKDTASFYVHNNRQLDVIIDTSLLSINGSDAANFDILTYPDSNLAVGDSTLIEIVFEPFEEGSLTAILDVVFSDTSCTATSSIQLNAIGRLPIQITGNGNVIKNGSLTTSLDNLTDFGSIVLNDVSASRTFTIKNVSADTVFFNGSPRVSIPQNLFDLFVVSSFPASYLAPNQSTTFDVEFRSLISGTALPIVEVPYGDSSLFTFKISGLVYGRNLLSFDGQNDYVNINSLASEMVGENAFTLEFGMEVNANQAGNDIILGVNTSSNGSRMFFLIDDGKLEFHVGTNSTLISNEDIRGTGFKNYVFIFNNGNLDFYLDGEFVSSVSNNIPSFSATDKWSIGQEYDNGGPSDFLHGELDEFRLWKGAKSHQSVLDLRYCELKDVDSSLVAYYNFNQGFSSLGNNDIDSLTDKSIYQNHGLIQGFDFANGNRSSNFYRNQNYINVNCYSISPEVCDQPTYISPSGMVLNSSGQYFDTIPKAMGGDSNMVVDLRLNYTNVVVDQVKDADLCTGDTYEVSRPTTNLTSTLNFEKDNDDWVALDGLEDSLVNTNRSVFLWMRAAGQVNGDNQVLVAMNSSGTATVCNFGIRTNEELWMYDGGNNRNSGVVVTDGKWHFVGYTYNEASNETKMYVDGVEVRSYSNGQSLSSTSRISLGQEFDGSSTSDFFDGEMTEVSIWKEVLDTNDIKAIMTAPIANSHANYSQLVAYYTANATCGESALQLNDFSGNNLHGTASSTSIINIDSLVAIEGFDASSHFNFSLTNNGSVVTPNNGQDYSITTAGNYQLAFERDYFSISDDFNVTVDLYPSINSQPIDISVPLGGTASFTVVTSTSPVDYQWYQLDDSLKTFILLTGETNPTLTIDTVNLALDSSKYFVELSTPSSPCSISSDTVLLTIDSNAFAIQFNIDSSISCYGLSDAGITASAINGTAPYTYLWSNSETTASITGISAGNYSVTVMDNNGESNTNSITIAEPDTLVASLTVANVSVNGGSDGQITATPTGGSNPFGYLWSNGANTAINSGLSAGTFTVTVTDNNGCTSINSADVLEPAIGAGPDIVISEISYNPPESGSDSTEFIEIYNRGINPVNLSGYSFTSGVVYTFPNITINVNEYLVVGVDSVALMNRFGISAYQWSSGGLSNGGEPIALKDHLGNLIDSLRYDDVAPWPISPDGDGSTLVLCNPNEDNSDGSNWLASSSIVNAVIINSKQVYASPGSDDYACNLSLTTSINLDSTVSCHGQSDAGITVSASNGVEPYTYTWSASAGSSSLASVSGLGAGKYKVTVSDNSGTTAIDSITITEPVLLTSIIQIDSNVSCNSYSNGGATVSANGGTTPYTYLWNNTATTASITGVAAGNYSITVTDANGCIANNNTTIIEPAVLLAAIALDSNDRGNGGGATATATGGTTPYSYLWSNTATTASITGVAAGNYTVTVTDDKGCSDIESVTITAGPSITIQLDSNVSCNGLSDAGATVNANGGAMPYTYFWSNNATNASITGVAAGTYTVTVTDNNSISAVDSISIIVEDNVIPTVLTQNTTVYLDANGLASITTANIDNGSNDNCGSVTLSLDSTNFDCSEVGVNTVTLYVTDANNNLDSATATVTVIDTLLPTVITQNATVYLDANGLASITTANIDNGSNDNCGSVTLSLDSTNFDCSEVGVNTVTLYATDANNNLDSATATVTVLDTLLPTVITQNTTVYLDANGLASITTADIDNGSNDNCGSVTLSLDSTNFDCSEVGVNSVTLYATDANNNLDSATATVTVVDTLLPTVITQNATIYLDANGLASINTANIDNGSNDNCGSVTLSLDSTNFDCSEVGANTVTLYVTDANNNLDSATATVTVIDTLLPTVITQNATVYLDANGLASITTADINNGSNDNCGNVTLSLDSTDFDCSEVGVNTVTLYATDANNNLDSATATVTVLDTLIPTVITQNATVYLDANGLASITTADIDNGSNDNCGNVSLSLDSTNFDCSEVGVNTVTLYATDANNNLDSATATVTVMDTLLPTVITQNTTIYLDANGLASITTANIDNGSNDNCGNVSLSLDSTNFDCSEVGVNTVILYATDANNNVDSATATVTVLDTLLPTVITQNVTVYLDANGLSSITTANIDNGSNDNCGNVSLSLDSTNFDCSEVGVNMVTLYVTDANNNVDSATAKVTVMDTLKPMILACPSNLNVFTDAGNCTAVVNWLAPTSTDNCGVDSLISNYAPGDSFGIGTTEVIYIAYDESLNTDTCRFTITVVDQEKPVIAGIPSNIIINNDSSICGAVVQWIAPTATDNCTLDSLRSNYSPGDVFPVGTSTVTYVAYDSDFNTDTASFTITVNDTEKPIIICPSNIAQCDSIVDFLDAISTDNCGIANMVRTDATGLNSGDQFPIGVSTLSYLATDIYNNQATCSFDVEVFTPPTANAGPNLATRDIEPVIIQASVTHAAQISWMPFMSLSDATIEQPLANPKTTTKYTLTVTSPEGCTVSDEMEIVVDVVQKLEATTLFSPNGDGRNDTWTVNKPELVSACKLVIFNRNGTEVYSTNNYNNDWDGTIRGENLPEGTYYYVFDCPDGRSFNGPITILRERR